MLMADADRRQPVPVTTVATAATAATATTATAHAAFDALYTAHRTPLYNYIYRLVGDREQADDLLQETFVKVYRALDTLPEEPGRTPWLYRVATNTCYDALRRRRLVSWLPWGSNGVHEPASGESGPGERYALGEGVQDALRQVPPALRAPLLLHAAHGLDYDDIARALGISRAAVKMRVSRGRALFRAAYQREEEQEL